MLTFDCNRNAHTTFRNNISVHNMFFFLHTVINFRQFDVGLKSALNQIFILVLNTDVFNH